MRQKLTEELSAKVGRYGVVLWVDPAGEYREVAADVGPEGVPFYRFAGSWYALRREIEPELDNAQPQMIIYLDIEHPAEDPLMEARSVGTEYRIRLANLMHQCLAEEYPSGKIEEMAGACVTLLEAEALAAGGTSGGPARVIKFLGVSEPTEITLAFLSRDEAANPIDVATAEEAAKFLGEHYGAAISSNPDTFADSLTRHLVLIELRHHLGALPPELEQAVPIVSDVQASRCTAILQRWRNALNLRTKFLARMRAANADLGLPGSLVWSDSLMAVDTVPAYEDLAFNEYLARLERNQFEGAELLAVTRLKSLWSTTGSHEEEWSELWTTALHIAQLRRLLQSSTSSSKTEIPAALLDYATKDWSIDRAHRRLELSLLNLVNRSPLEDAIRTARQGYENWLDSYLRRFTAALERDGLDLGELLPQGAIHRRYVVPRTKQGKVAYFMVDALRFELGHELLDALALQFSDSVAEISPAVALLPSITPVGMANLCPDAEDNLRLELVDRGRLGVFIGNTEIRTVQDRIGLLQATHGRVADLRLDDVLRSGDAELGEVLADSSLVLVRSQEIDAGGELGRISAGLQSFEATVQQLSRAVARLTRHSVNQFVITADHGFLALTRDLGSHAIIPKPGGLGELHRRAFFGRGGTAGDGLMRISLSKCGLPGDLDVLVPRGLALISAGGARGFFHGGASPQELIVPVVTLETRPPAGSTVVTIEANLTGKITSHVFTGKVVMPEGLFSEPITVRPVPVRDSDGTTIAMLVTAGGAEEGEGLIRLQPGEEIVLGFRTTVSLGRNDKITLQVFDARTDRRLAMSKPATVARQLEVEDEII